MIGLAVVALGLAAAPEATDFAIRMQQSAVAAQALQGPLDGTWTLWNARQQPLFVLQISDPAGGAGPLQGAWRRTSSSAASGPIDIIARQGDHMTLRFDATALSLQRRNDGSWFGEANEGGQEQPVALRRSALDAAPR